MPWIFRFQMIPVSRKGSDGPPQLADLRFRIGASSCVKMAQRSCVEDNLHKNLLEAPIICTLAKAV